MIPGHKSCPPVISQSVGGRWQEIQMVTATSEDKAVLQANLREGSGKALDQPRWIKSRGHSHVDTELRQWWVSRPCTSQGCLVSIQEQFPSLAQGLSRCPLGCHVSPAGCSSTTKIWEQRTCLLPLMLVPGLPATMCPEGRDISGLSTDLFPIINEHVISTLERWRAEALEFRASLGYTASR